MAVALRLALASSTAVLAICTAGGASAAEGTADQANAAPAVEEVVVTAEKRSENLQVVPASVSAITGSKMEDLGLKNLHDYAQYVPGLNITQSGSPGQVYITLRGLAPVGQGSLVGAYIDDTPMGSSGGYAKAAQFSLDLLPYDLDRFEVLRGPQGTLYGAGAMGGLVKYVLKPANPDHFAIQAGGETSYIDHSDGLGYAVRGMINVPVVTDKLALRFSAFDQKDQGYVDNVRLGRDDVNDVEQYGGRAAATWQATSNLRVNLNAIWYRLKSDSNNTVRLGDVTTYTDPGGAVVYTGKPTLGDYAQSYAFLEPFDKRIDYYSGVINWDVAGLTAISATSWSNSRTSERRDLTDNYGLYPVLFGLAPGLAPFDLNLGLKKFTQEFRLASPTGGRFEWLVGGYYTHEDSTNHQVIHILDASYNPITGPLAPVFNPYFIDVQLPSTYEEYAAFGDLTFHITPRFDVTGGLRYAHNTQHFAEISDGVALGGYADLPGDSAQGVTTWQVNARYHFTDDVMLYGRIATGYRPGGPNASLNGQPVKPVDADTLINYEAGLKSAFLGGRAILNLSAFDIEWKGIQLNVVDPTTGAGNLANGGDAFSRGFELEGMLVPIEGLRIGYNAAYTKAELTDLAIGAPPFLLGYQLPNVPRWSAGATADYQWPIGADLRANVGAGIRYVGAQWDSPVSAPGYTPNTRSPAYTTVDLRAGVETGRYRINFYVRNLADKRVYLNHNPYEDLFSGSVYAIDSYLLQPRTVGVSVDASF